MSAADRDVRCAQTTREHAHPTSLSGDGRDPGDEVAGLAERVHAHAGALGDLARALAEELAEEAS